MFQTVLYQYNVSTSSDHTLKIWYNKKKNSKKDLISYYINYTKSK